MNKIIAKNYKTIISNNIKKDLLIKKPTIYIIDFLNIFSDFREIKYKGYAP